MTNKRLTGFNAKTFLSKMGGGKTILKYKEKDILFSQGDAADAVFYIQEGRVKLTVVSAKGKEAVVAILERTGFFGEGCLAGQPLRMAAATALDAATIVRIDKAAMIRVLHEEPTFSELFLAYQCMLIMQDDIKQRTMNMHAAVVLNEAELPELVHKKTNS